MQTTRNTRINQKNITRVLAALLALLFAYAAASKLLTFEAFKDQMLNQAVPSWLGHALTWSLPGTELLAAGLLIGDRFRRIGFWLSFVLLFLFTAYIVFVLAGFAGRVPCSCGGVLRSMGWKTHLVFNIFFLLLSSLGIYQADRERRLNGDR